MVPLASARTFINQPIGCFYVAAEPGARISLSLQSENASPAFHAVIRHVVTGSVVGQGQATLGLLQLDLQLKRPRLAYLSEYWGRIDDCVARGILPAEYHYEILVFHVRPVVSDPLPDVGDWDSPTTRITMAVDSLGARQFDPRNVDLRPWDPVSTPDVNPWPIP